MLNIVLICIIYPFSVSIFSSIASISSIVICSPSFASTLVGFSDIAFSCFTNNAFRVFQNILSMKFSCSIICAITLQVPFESSYYIPKIMQVFVYINLRFGVENIQICNETSNKIKFCSSIQSYLHWSFISKVLNFVNAITESIFLKYKVDDTNTHMF